MICDFEVINSGQRKIKMSNKPLCFVNEFDDSIWIKVKYSGIHALVVAIDGIPLSFLGKGKSKTAYVKVSDAIAWHEKELRETNGESGDEKVLAALTKILSK